MQVGDDDRRVRHHRVQEHPVYVAGLQRAEPHALDAPYARHRVDHVGQVRSAAPGLAAP